MGSGAKLLDSLENNSLGFASMGVICDQWEIDLRRFRRAIVGDRIGGIGVRLGFDWGSLHTRRLDALLADSDVPFADLDEEVEEVIAAAPHRLAAVVLSLLRGEGGREGVVGTEGGGEEGGLGDGLGDGLDEGDRQDHQRPECDRVHPAKDG